MADDPEGRRIPCVLSIAGSDSGGGAGIQADLKAFARCGVHGMTAITAITWQNTVGVAGVTPVPPDAIIGQVKAVADDIGVDAVKIGMLGTVETIEAVEKALDLRGRCAGRARSGDGRRERRTVARARCAHGSRRDLLPRATVVTPNLDEARRAGRPAKIVEALIRSIHAFGSGNVVITGGHGHGDEVVDLFFDGTRVLEISGERYADGASHGSGCTHSSVLAAQLALGLEPLEAAREAQRIASEAVRDGLREIGAGAGPVNVLGI